jgi:hypothetical protein
MARLGAPVLTTLSSGENMSPRAFAGGYAIILIALAMSSFTACARNPANETGTPTPITTQPPTPTDTPTPVPVSKSETVYDDLSLTWLECGLPSDYYHNWRAAEGCLGLSLPSWQATDRARLGEYFERTPQVFKDIRLVIGADVYETGYQPCQSEFCYTLYKNGRPFATASAYFTSYNPNRALMDIGGKSAWELADYRSPTIIYDGIDLRAVYGLEAAYVPYEINGKLIFAARKEGKFLVVYEGKPIGPAFDEIAVGYCCGPAAYSIWRAQGQYWFWGKRGDQHFVVAIYASTR